MVETADEDTFTREQIEDILVAFEDCDAVAAAEAYAEDGVFIDPHYPESEYRGPEEIQEGLEWALENVVEQPGLTIRNLWEDAGTFAVEVETHHTMQDGTEAEFPQVFIIESENGQVTRWQSYLPFPPPADE
jgi:ketosteroid isomerase-like protein